MVYGQSLGEGVRSSHGVDSVFPLSQVPLNIVTNELSAMSVYLLE